jgi:HlyD family secretion protein
VGLARATLDQSRRSTERAERLRAAGTLSAEAFEEAQLALTLARREADAARESAAAAAHEVDVARAALIAARTGASAADERVSDASADAGCAAGPCIEVRAPVAGSVLRVIEESERIVLAGAPLVEIGDPGRLEIVVDVLSTDAVRIRPGADVWIEQWGGDRPLRGKVRRIEPSAFTKISALGVEEQRVNVIADLVEGAAGLGDGYRIEARIVVWESPDVLRVPASALFRAGEAWAVFAIEDGRARRREIELGERGSAQAEVRAHLVEGERVILHPSDRLADGARVEAF